MVRVLLAPNYKGGSSGRVFLAATISVSLLLLVLDSSGWRIDEQD